MLPDDSFWIPCGSCAMKSKRRTSANQIVVRHLLSTLFVYVLREWADAALPLAGNWFSALRSPHIARALACIYEAPANDWTLDALAEAAGLSRSAFAAQFRTSVGEPSHSYLIRWRMGIAAQLLEHTGLRLAEIAARFAIAFKVGKHHDAALPVLMCSTGCGPNRLAFRHPLQTDVLR